jgi:hypothetical protein
MSIRRPFNVVSALLIAALVSACAGGGLQVQPLDVPSTPSVGALPEASSKVAVDQPIGSATELYSRIARGAMSCWFATGGPLKKDYIYHATADAPSRGGKAEIVIYQRDPTQPNPRGPKTYLVDFAPTGESTATIKTENLKMTEAFAASMTDDVGRWAKGDQGCAGDSTTAGWAPAPPEAEAPPKAKVAKGKKAKVKAAQAKPLSKAKPVDALQAKPVNALQAKPAGTTTSATPGAPTKAAAEP